MSKLYNKYEILKSEDLECIYLFLCGNFYIALDSDAIILNELFDMKLDYSIKLWYIEYVKETCIK